MKIVVFLFCLLFLLFPCSSEIIEGNGIELSTKSFRVSAKITNHGYSIKTPGFSIGTPSETGFLSAIDRSTISKGLKPEVGVNKTYKDFRMAVVSHQNNYAFILIGKRNSIGYTSCNKYLSFGAMIVFPDGGDQLIQEDWRNRNLSPLLYSIGQYHSSYFDLQIVGVIDSRLCQKYKLNVAGHFKGFELSYRKGYVPGIMADVEVDSRYSAAFQNEKVSIQYVVEKGREPIYSYGKRMVDATLSVETFVYDIRVSGKYHAKYGKGSPKLSYVFSLTWKEWTIDLDKHLNPVLTFRSKIASFTIGKGKNETSLSMSIKKENCLISVKASSKKTFSLECSLEI